MIGSSIRKAALLLAGWAALLGGPSTPLAAQEGGTVRGTVTDVATQRPLASVQVAVPGTDLRAVTGEEGEYSLSNVPAGPTLVRAQLPGYGSEERTVAVVAGQAVRADFALSAATIELDALVVTGTPGATQKRELGNAVTRVNVEELTDKAPIATVTQLLQGRAPGVTIAPGAGTNGTAAQIRIRGQSSIAAGNQPIFVVDGVRISGTQNGFGVSGQSRSPLDFIPPEDIESIEIIKGPAAATLYGAEAASGVIQIITKKGKVGQQGIQWAGKLETGRLNWELDNPVNFALCTPARIRTAARGQVGDYVGCVGLDSLAPAETRVLRQDPIREDPNALRTGEILTYSLSARGGGEQYSFFASAERDDESGVFYNNDSDRTAGRANFFVKPLDQLDLAFNAGFSRSNSRLPLNDNASNGLLRNAFRGIPGVQGQYAVGWRGLSPTEINIYDNQLRSDRLVLGTTANYQPFSWFRNRATLGLDLNSSVGTIFYPIDQTGKAPYGSDVAGGAIYHVVPESRTYTVDYAGTISNDLPWGELASDFSFGMQLNARRLELYQTEGEGLVADPLRLVGSATVTRASSDVSEQNSLGYFVQEQIGWKNRLFLTGAVRIDDNSAFGQDFSLETYPKVSASWVVSEEPFFGISGVDNLRLRAAWGQAGNAPGPFSADRTYGASAVVLENGTFLPALRSASFGNDSLRAETGSEFEAGFETALWGGRAGIDLTYYNKHTYDALIPVPVAPSLGFGGANFRTRLQNAGEIANSGVEIALFGTPVVSRALNWDTRLAFSTNRNRMIDLGGIEAQTVGAFATVQIVREGLPLGTYFGFDVVRNPDGSLQRDAAGRVVLSTDTVFVGPSTPTREASLTNTLQVFGNLSLYVFADYQGGHYMWNAGEYIRNRNDRNAWEVVNPNADPDDVAIRQSGSTLPFISQADFVKLREVSVTYSLPSRWVERIGADDLSFTLGGRNLAIWTKYDGMDPELNFSGIANVAGFGSVLRTDYMSVPMIRRLVASVNVGF